MKRQTLIKQLNRAVAERNRYNELVIYGTVDDSGENKWQTITLGAFDERQELSDSDYADIAELISKWRDYFIATMDNNCVGRYAKGEITFLGLASGNDAKAVCNKALQLAQADWRRRKADAIRRGIESGGGGNGKS